MYVPISPVPVPNATTIVFRGIPVPESIMPIAMGPVSTAVTVNVLVKLSAAVAILPVNLAVMMPLRRTFALALFIQEVAILHLFPMESA